MMLMYEESNDEKYHIKIIRRDLQQAGDDYHATVTRLSDRTQLMFIGRWKWLLKLLLIRPNLDREFRYQDRRDRKLAEEEEFIR